MLMVSKNVYVLQPYEVGTKQHKSLAVIIPARVAREYNVNKATILALSVNPKDKRITLQKVDVAAENMTIPASESVEASSKQVSFRVQ
jgi:antitoxin component of MazEF toxin-antitoxin module